MKEVGDKSLTLIIELTKEGANPMEVTCRADYEVTSDGVRESRSLEVELTASQETSIKSFAQQVVNKVKQVES